ncbi:hypothetical protein GCM10027199_56330 [Amycolatopsis magusensis]
MAHHGGVDQDVERFGGQHAQCGEGQSEHPFGGYPSSDGIRHLLSLTIRTDNPPVARPDLALSAVVNAQLPPIS